MNNIPFPISLTRSPVWGKDDVLIIEAENTALYMVNLHVVFCGKKQEVSVRVGIFPHWPCRIPLPLATATGQKLFLSRTPGRFKATVAGANLAFEDIEEIIVTVPDEAIPVVKVTRVTVEPKLPQEYPMPPTPLVDELHQWRGREWPGKASSLEMVQEALTSELAAPTPIYPPNWSRYGGWKSLRFRATGFFRTEFTGERWWLVDPEGHAFWSLGCDCVRPEVDVNVAGIESVFSPPLPSPESSPQHWHRSPRAQSFNGLGHNLERILGPDWRTRWMELTSRRMRAYRFNTIANWSDPDLPAHAGIPYVFTMKSYPGTARMLFRDFPDVFAPEFTANAKLFAEQLIPHREDPTLLGYFMTNEPQWAFVNGFDLGEQILRSPEPSASRTALLDQLRGKYGSITALNSAWGSRFHAFEDLGRPTTPESRSMSGNDTAAFTEQAVERYVGIPASACRHEDPHHLNLGLRWAWIHSDYQLAGAQHLDAFSINQYQLRPNAEAIAELTAKTGKPIMIGEFHIGALDRGLPSGGIRNTRTMAESVQAYRYYIENAVAIPSLLGVHYFQWNDQHVMGRFDGENMQIGLHDITGRAYPEWVDICRTIHPTLENIAMGKTKPTSKAQETIPQGTLVW